MTDRTPMDNRTLLRRTLVVGGSMVGACVLFVGMLVLVASAVVGHAMASNAEVGAAAPSTHASSPITAGAKPSAGLNTIHRK